MFVVFVSNAAAQQNRTTYTIKTEVKEYIDFTGVDCNGNNPVADPNWDGNRIPSLITKSDGTVIRYYNAYPIYVGTNPEGSTTTSTNLYSGRVTFDWSTNFTISANNFNNAKVGDIIRVYYTNKGSDFNPVYKYVGSWGDLYALQNVIERDHDGYFQAAINQDALTEIKANGLRLQGIDFTLTSVDLISSNSSNPADTWQLWKGSHGQTYLQKKGQNDDYFNIENLKEGDVVTIWGDNGNNGGFRVTSNNTNKNNQNITFENQTQGQEITMGSDGTLQLLFYGQYSGILKIEIKRQLDQTTTFDYDPGYEEYDMYDEFSRVKGDNPATTYSVSGSAGFQLKGKNANYVEFEDSKITTNNRIALTGAANEWTFDFGIVPPGNNGDYSYLSICNLREGDRVVISYINDSEDPLIFASGKDSETGEYYYSGCAAFKDDSRDGVLNDGEQFVYNGYVAPVDWHRGEGNVGASDNGFGSSYLPELCYINSYVITQDGHLDLAFRRFVENDDTNGDHQDPNKKVSRIVKIKIFSDHQAMMVDTWDEVKEHYKAYYNITGELQAKEHIMPGGLEIFVGNNDASQHALVVSSKNGPVSYVNAVDGFKIPGVSKNGEQVSINFDLGINRDYAKLPTTGTFYRFVPEVNGKMSFMFETKSMNYYRWDMKGNSVYHNTDLQNSDGNFGNWVELYDRPNEQTVDADCPYYLVTVKNNRILEVRELGRFRNGGEWTENEFSVEKDKEYYLFGGWNQTGLYYNSSWTTPDISNDDRNNDANGSKVYNNIEFRPFDGRTVGCGVAQLLWVTFDPQKKIYPLAKWVPNDTKEVKTGSGVPNPDTFEMEYELADLWGYDSHTKLTVKKMSGNIESCHPFLQRTGATPASGNPTYKLMIDGITFKNGKNPGGTILIKIDDPSKRENPLYSLTIAYSAAEQYDNQQSEVINSGKSENVRGHIWDFHTKSLNGLTWGNPYRANGAVATEMGTYFDNYFNQSIENYSSALEVKAGLDKNEHTFLWDEVENEEKGDWMFNYNLVYDGNLIDPVFTNKYDMTGDNADMIWDTEGTIFQTSANQCAIFNEYGEVIDHEATSTTDDPNRYVALLKGGKFRIPWLQKNDRVIIWMGSGTGRTDDFASLKIKNAYDALHNEINPNDEYIVGGSQWNGKDGDANYRGCYHFFAKGDDNSPAAGNAADMVFEMIGGEMCKIYKVRIYRGDRIITNEIVGKTENDNHYLLYSTAADPNDTNSEDYTNENRYNWTLKYFGKKQQLANGSGKNNQDNEIVAKTGKYSSDNPALTDNYKTVENENAETGETEEVATTEVESFTYMHELGEIGTFRMRGKDMEKNMNYVADYADHNVTIAYQETMNYPYTWDFTDVTGIQDNVTILFAPEEKLGEETTPPTGISSDDWANAAESYQRTARDLSLWETSGTSGNYFLRLNSQSTQSLDDKMVKDNIFETAKEIGGNQVWANGKIVPEMQGLLFYTDDNYQENGEWTIKQGKNNVVGGLEFDGPNDFLKIVVPNVPKDHAVYLRMTKSLESPVLKYKFGEEASLNTITNGNDMKILQVEGKDNDFIVALLNTGSSKANLTFALDGYRLQKMAVSKDPKKLNKYGWATESRERIIDPELTAYMTGQPIKTFMATSASINDRKVLLTEVDGVSYVMNKATGDGDPEACILYNSSASGSTGTDVDFNVDILNGGFHLFVPDMHDYDIYNRLTAEQLELKQIQNMDESIMKAQLTPRDAQDKLPMYEVKNGVSYTNYVLTYSTAKAGWDANTGNIPDTDNPDIGKVGFYRVQPAGVTSKGNQGYIQFLTSDVKPGGNSNFFSIVFDGDDLDSISNTSIETSSNAEPFYYNIWGQKFSGQPKQPGIYIVNGKKVTVK